MSLGRAPASPPVRTCPPSRRFADIGGEQRLPNCDQFQAGGFLQLSGMRTGQLPWRSLTSRRLVADCQLIDMHEEPSFSRQAVLAADAPRVAGFLGKRITHALAQEIGSRLSTRIEGRCIKQCGCGRGQGRSAITTNRMCLANPRRAKRAAIDSTKASETKHIGTPEPLRGQVWPTVISRPETAAASRNAGIQPAMNKTRASLLDCKTHANAVML